MPSFSGLPNYSSGTLNGDELIAVLEDGVLETMTTQQLVYNLPQDGVLLTEIDELPGYDGDPLDGSETIPLYEDDEGVVEGITPKQLMSNLNFDVNIKGQNRLKVVGNIVIERGGSQTDNSWSLDTDGDTKLEFYNFQAGTNFAFDKDGTFSAPAKNFRISHPDPEKEDTHTLRHGSLEGPENGVYQRGTLDGSAVIDLPSYWPHLIDPTTITVNLTAIGSFQQIYVVEKSDDAITLGIGNGTVEDIHCDYTVYAERKDVDPLVVEEEKTTP